MRSAISGVPAVCRRLLLPSPRRLMPVRSAVLQAGRRQVGFNEKAGIISGEEDAEDLVEIAAPGTLRQGWRGLDLAESADLVRQREAL